MTSLGRIKVPVRLVRFLGFDGANISFADNSSPTTPETLPLASGCHEFAAKLQPYQLCKATIHNGTVLLLEPTKALVPATS